MTTVKTNHNIIGTDKVVKTQWSPGSDVNIKDLREAMGKHFKNGEFEFGSKLKKSDIGKSVSNRGAEEAKEVREGYENFGNTEKGVKTHVIRVDGKPVVVVSGDVDPKMTKASWYHATQRATAIDAKTGAHLLHAFADKEGTLHFRAADMHN